MAFPTPSDFTLSSSASGLSHSMTLPSGIQVGDTLVAVVTATGATVSTPTGWTLRGSGVNTGRIYVFSRLADGSEGSTLTVTTTINNGVSMIACRVPDAGTGFVVSTAATGSSTGPDSASLTPSWGSADTLWFTCFTANGGVTTIAPPANYTPGQSKPGNQVIAVAWRQHTTATEDPGAFTIGSSQGWVALTFAIQPSVVAPPANAPTLVGLQAKGGSAVDATVIDRSTTETQFVLESAPDAALTGTVTTDGTTAALVGVSTLFTTEAAQGTRLRIGADPATYEVSSVTDDTHATLTKIPPAAQAGVAASKPGTFDTASPVASVASTTTASTGTAYTLSAASLTAGARLWFQARSKNSGGTGPASPAQHIVTTAAGASAGTTENADMIVPTGVNTTVPVAVRDASNNPVTDAVGIVPQVSIGGAAPASAQHALVAIDAAAGEYGLIVDGTLEATADNVALVYYSPDSSRKFRLAVQAFQGTDLDPDGKVILAPDQSAVTVGTVSTLAAAPTNFSAMLIGTDGKVTLSSSQTFSTTGSVGSVTGAVGSVTGSVASVTALGTQAKADVTAAVPTAAQNADALLGRNVAGGSDGGVTVSTMLKGDADILFDGVGGYTVKSKDGVTTLTSGTYAVNADGSLSLNAA